MLGRFKGFLTLLAICIVALIAVACSMKFGIPLTCPFKRITGLPCPGCGGVRCVILLLKGDFTSAVITNPVSVVFMVFIVVSIGWLFIDGYNKSNSYKRIVLGKWNPKLVWVVLLVISANWLWNILKRL